MTIASEQVMRQGLAITHVYHDEDDHGWQFHGSVGTTMADSLLVKLEEVVKIDPSVLEIADLPPGWVAWRADRGGPWQKIRQTYPDVIVDWETIRTIEDFFDKVLPQCGSPSWHGRNLDALNDSWVTGGIDALGPPYDFQFSGKLETPDDLSSFREKVCNIARRSVEENGGRFEE